MEPLTLTAEQEADVLALVGWAFAGKPGIPNTGVLRGLYRGLIERDHQRREAEGAGS